jgi:Flp pilus assembly protein TadD
MRLPLVGTSESLAEILDHRVVLRPALLSGYDWDWASAEKEYKRALALNPGYATAHQWYASHLMVMGRNGEAIAEFRRAIELSGGNTTPESNLANAYAVSGRKEEAMKIAKDLESGQSQGSSTDASIALIYVGLDDNDRAMIWLHMAR